MFDAEEEIRPERLQSSLKLQEGVEISHIDFFILPDKPYFERCQHFCPKGQMTAVVGPTGSGKPLL